MATSHTRERGDPRKSFAAVADALVEWREEFGETAKRHNDIVMDKIADAARAVGWPEEAVDATRTHLSHMSKFQVQMLDQFIDSWQQQLKSPVAAEFLSGLRGAGAGMQSATAMSNLANNPFELWMQATLAWQRNLASALSLWGIQDRSRHH
jgi:hypothetical protein